MADPRVFALSLILAACGGASSSTAAGPGPSAPTEEAEAPPEVSADQSAAGASDKIEPQSLYESCKDRVEGREADGECTTDADCGTAGCSGEVCVTASLASEVMTTCEVKPCFAVLDQCGCVEGRCAWSLKTPEGPGALLGEERGSLPPKGDGSAPPKPPPGEVH